MMDEAIQSVREDCLSAVDSLEDRVHEMIDELRQDIVELKADLEDWKDQAERLSAIIDRLRNI
jgi:hypothetical protein